MERVIAYLALGTNIGDKAGNLRRAVELLQESDACRVTAVSPVYRTTPVGYMDQPDFLNAVIAIETELNPLDLLALCNTVEKRMGRERTIRWGPRVIDIDILLYNNLAIDSQELTIPHPRMMERAFVLVPLADIAPDVELPGGVSAKQAAESISRDGIERLDIMLP